MFDDTAGRNDRSWPDHRQHVTVLPIAKARHHDQRNAIEHRFFCHPVIAVWVIGRDRTFIHPVEIELVPGHLREEWLAGVGEQLKRSFRG